MKHVTVFVGTATKRHTYHAVERFLGHLHALGDVESEIVRLSEYRLEVCKGCRVCLDKGEELCHLKDDRDLLIYFSFIAGAMGFNTVKGACIMTMEPVLEKQQHKIDQQLAELSQRFHKRLMQPAYPAPSLLDLMVFRMGRTSRKLLLDETSRDYTYMRDKGWFESGYYYPAPIGPLKGAAGKLFDWAGARLAASRFGGR